MDFNVERGCQEIMCLFVFNQAEYRDLRDLGIK